jgi:hypothetical protein
MPCVYLNFDLHDQFVLYIVWLHAHALDVRVDLEGPVAALDGMKDEAVSTRR